MEIEPLEDKKNEGKEVLYGGVCTIVEECDPCPRPLRSVVNDFRKKCVENELKSVLHDMINDDCCDFSEMQQCESLCYESVPDCRRVKKINVSPRPVCNEIIEEIECCYPVSPFEPECVYTQECPMPCEEEYDLSYVCNPVVKSKKCFNEMNCDFINPLKIQKCSVPKIRRKCIPRKNRKVCVYKPPCEEEVYTQVECGMAPRIRAIPVCPPPCNFFPTENYRNKCLKRPEQNRVELVMCKKMPMCPVPTPREPCFDVRISNPIKNCTIRREHCFDNRNFTGGDCHDRNPCPLVNICDTAMVPDYDYYCLDLDSDGDIHNGSGYYNRNRGSNGIFYNQSYPGDGSFDGPFGPGYNYQPSGFYPGGSMQDGLILPNGNRPNIIIPPAVTVTRPIPTKPLTLIATKTATSYATLVNKVTSTVSLLGTVTQTVKVYCPTTLTNTKTVQMYCTTTLTSTETRQVVCPTTLTNTETVNVCCPSTIIPNGCFPQHNICGPIQTVCSPTTIIKGCC